MSRLFISPSANVPARWYNAFEQIELVQDPRLIDAEDNKDFASLWLDFAALALDSHDAVLAAALARGRPVVVMSATPSEAEAFNLIKAGAQGYCHVQAAPEQLREIALVVEHGGLWMPPALMQRFLALSTRVTRAEPPDWTRVEALTERELMVAERVGQGASNREIATALNISERTVKAHLTTIFDKLDVRDRVQLALAMNNIEIPARRAAH